MPRLATATESGNCEKGRRPGPRKMLRKLRKIRSACLEVAWILLKFFPDCGKKTGCASRLETRGPVEISTNALVAQ